MKPRDKLGAYEIIAPIGAGYTVQGDSFIPGKPRLWSAKTLANLVNVSKNVDLAPDGKRVVTVMPAEAGESQHHIVLWKTSSMNSGAVRR